ncbi:hypothetical protein P153DRAFT_433340 [Dothidotthia symphoricarpi CBS 119687]|uniref:Uncharacterized protein n=1 Tax=Dothidotthia symphoricarpi CBS 119687 TaxID=1392245 RepID=A0A6A6A6T6_9PLEO|nr:uncharacterized protein P153DRAFT_433340 [Dothidotthia symphoricarpi CBS 119687]KAF2126833.1 hypothetical protein P153DRAFT_433340 [Dothidotthia symphoricarpi CBS 119687]
MIPQLALAIVAALNLFKAVSAEIAPELTTVVEGYNVIAKLPCIGCPFLYQDTSKGSNEPWIKRKDKNALLLNISLPFDSAHLSVNTAALLTSSNVLPRIFANQVLLDTSKEDLAKLIDADQLESGGYFGISYAYSLRHVKDSTALVFQFDISELWSDLPETPITVKLDDPAQKMLEVVLLQRPMLSASDPGPAYEIIRTSLVARPESSAHQRTMAFHEWDAFGQKGTSAHLFSSLFDAFITYLSSGVWALFTFVFGIIGLFVVICLFCIFGWGFWKDEYEQAQHGKRRGGSGNDVEKARRFRSAEELGLRGGGNVVGVGKSD